MSRKSLIALLEDNAKGSQPFAQLIREKRPQDPQGLETCERGGNEPDTMPQAIEATDAADAQGRSAIYVPTRGGEIVIPRPKYRR